MNALAAASAVVVALAVTACDDKECTSTFECDLNEVCSGEGACVPEVQAPGGGGGPSNRPPPAPTTAGSTGDSCASASCGADLDCVGSFCVGRGVQRVSMLFDGATDMDLHLIFPSGEELFYGHRTVEAGELDVDQCVDSPSCVGSSHVENIFFSAAPAPGSYTIRTENYNGASSSNVTVEVVGLANQTFSGSVAATSSAFLEFQTQF